MTDNEKLNVNTSDVIKTNENANQNVKKNDDMSSTDDLLSKSVNTYYVPQIKSKEITKIIPMNKKDTIFMILLFVISFLIVDFVFFNGFNLGFTLLFFALFIFTSLYLFKKEIKASVFTYVCGALSLVSAVGPTLFDSVIVKIITVSVSLLLFTVYTCGISGTFRSKEGSFKIVIDMVSGILFAPFVNIVDVAKSFKASLTKNKKSFDAIIGVIIAIPLLCIIVPLLVRSDDAFAGLINKAVANLGSYVAEFMLVILLIPYLISYFYSKKANYKTGSESIINGNKNTKFLTNGISVSFLSVISITYIVYLLSQLAYFFSAFSGILPEGYEFSASVYARRGFYEMFVICIINIAIISVVNLFTKKSDKNKISPVLKGLECFISLFSILLLVIAMSKMKLNIEHFGLSKPRLVVALVEFMLFVVIVFFLIHIFFPKVQYMQTIIVICSLMFIGFSFVDIDANIAKYNVEMYQKGSLSTVDVNYLNMLSDTALPYIIELTDDKNEDVAAEVKTTIRYTYHYHYKDSLEINDDNEMVVRYKPDFRNYNYTDVKACKYIAEYYNSLSYEDKIQFLDTDKSYYAPVEDYYYQYDNEYNAYQYNYYEDNTTSQYVQQ